MNKELWENATNLIDEEFADEAAEYFAKHGKTEMPKDDDDYGESVSPVAIKTNQKSSKLKTFVAVAAAAAAVVLCVITGRMLMDSDIISPVIDPANETSESTETSETDETDDYVPDFEVCREIAEMFIKSHLEFDEGTMLDTMFVQAENIGGEKSLVAITVPTYPDYSTFVYLINDDKATPIGHLFNTSTVEFFTKGDEVLVHTIWQTSTYAISAVNYEEYYLTLSENGERTNIGTVRRVDSDGKQQVFIGGLNSDGSFGDYTEVDYADYIAEKLRITEGWSFVMGKDFRKADEYFSTESDHFRIIGNVDTVASYILEAFGYKSTITDSTLDINEATAIAIAEDYLPQHHRNHTDATGDTMYVMAVRQSSDCALVLMTIPQNDVTEYNTVIYTADGNKVEWVDNHFRSNYLELYTNDEGILFHSLYIYEAKEYTGYFSYEETFYTLIDGEYTCVGEMMHVDDNGEMKNIYITDFSIDTSEGDTNRVESTYDEYLAEIERVTKGWTLADSVRFPEDSEDAEGFQKIGDKNVVSGYITDALRKNDVSTDIVATPVSLKDVSDKTAEMFLELNSADGKDMLVMAGQAGDKLYAVTFVPHILRYDAHIFEIDGDTVSTAQYNSLSTSVADIFEFYTKNDKPMIHFSNWLYDLQTAETSYTDCYYTIDAEQLSLINAVRRIENEEGETISYHIYDETIPTTNGLGFKEVTYPQYSAEIARLTDGYTLTKRITFPHDGSSTEDFKPIGEKDIVADYFYNALLMSNETQISGTDDNEEENDLPTQSETIVISNDHQQIFDPSPTMTAETAEEISLAVAELFLQQSPETEKLSIRSRETESGTYIVISYTESNSYTMQVFYAENGSVSLMAKVQNASELSLYDDVVDINRFITLNGKQTIADTYYKTKSDKGYGAQHYLKSIGIILKVLDDSGKISACYVTDGTSTADEFDEVSYSVYTQKKREYQNGNIGETFTTGALEELSYPYQMSQDKSIIADYIYSYLDHSTPANPGHSKPSDAPSPPCYINNDILFEVQEFAYIWHDKKWSVSPESVARDMPEESEFSIDVYDYGKIIYAYCIDGNERIPLEYSEKKSVNGLTLYNFKAPKSYKGKIYCFTVQYSYGEYSYCFSMPSDEPSGYFFTVEDYVVFDDRIFTPEAWSGTAILDENGNDVGIGEYKLDEYGIENISELEYISENDQGKFYRKSDTLLLCISPMSDEDFGSWYDWHFNGYSEKYPKEWCYNYREWVFFNEYSDPDVILADYTEDEYTLSPNGTLSLSAGVYTASVPYSGRITRVVGRSGDYNGTEMFTDGRKIILKSSDKEYTVAIYVTFGDKDCIYYATVTPSDITLTDEPPSLYMLVDSEAKKLPWGSYSWLNTSGDKLNADSLKGVPLIVPYGADLQIQLTNGAKIYSIRWKDTDEHGEEIYNSDDHIAFSNDGKLYIPTDKYNGIAEITVRYPQGTCTYYFSIVTNTEDEAMFITEITNAVQSADTIADMKRTVTALDLNSRIDDIRVYNNHDDYVRSIEVTDGLLTEGMVVHITYNDGKSYMLITSTNIING